MKSGGMENTLMDKTGIQNDLDTLDKRSEEKWLNSTEANEELGLCDNNQLKNLEIIL